MAKYLDSTGLTQVWTKAKSTFAGASHTHDGRYVRIFGLAEKDFNIPDSDGYASGVYYVHSNATQSNYPSSNRYGIIVNFNTGAGHLQFFATGDNIIKARSYWWTNGENFKGYTSWVDLIHSGNISSQSVSTATTASKLSTVSKTAWGQTYWTSGGVPTDISGAMTGVSSITSPVGSRVDIYTNDSGNSVVIGQGGVPYFRLDTNHRIHIGDNVSSNDATEKLQVDGNILASSFIKSGGTSSQFLKANGSVDSNSYSLSSHNHDGTYLKLSGGTLSGPLAITTPTTSYESPALKLNYYSDYSVTDYSIAQLKFGPTAMDSYLGIAPSARTVFGKNAYFFHVGNSYEFDWMSSSWSKLMALEASTGNLWIKGTLNGGTPITSSNIGSQSVNYATSAGDANTLDGQHGSYYHIHTSRSYTSVDAMPSGSEGWYNIFTISDVDDGAVICTIKAYAHSSLTFIASKGYATSATLQILQYNSSGNGGYFYVKGVRIVEGGKVQALFNKTSGASSNISVIINIFSSRGTLRPNTTLTLETGNPTVIAGPLNGTHGKITSDIVGNITGNAGSVAWSNVSGKPSTFTPSDHTHSYLPLSGGTLSNTVPNILTLKRTDTGGGAFIDYYHAGQTTHYWRGGSRQDGVFTFYYDGSTETLSLTNSAITYKGNTIWHAGNLTKVSQLTNDSGYITGSGRSAESKLSDYLRTPVGVTARVTSLNDLGKDSITVGYGRTMVRADLVSAAHITDSSAPPAPSGRSSYGYLLSFSWEGNGFNGSAASQLFIPNGDHVTTRAGEETLMYRGNDNGTWSSWYKLVSARSGSVGSATQPVYIDADGFAKACTSYASASVNYANSSGSASNASTASKWANARTLTIGNTGKSVDGSGNVSWSLNEIGAAASGHNHDGRYYTYVELDSHYINTWGFLYKNYYTVTQTTTKVWWYVKLTFAGYAQWRDFQLNTTYNNQFGPVTVKQTSFGGAMEIVCANQNGNHISEICYNSIYDSNGKCTFYIKISPIYDTDHYSPSSSATLQVWTKIACTVEILSEAPTSTSPWIKTSSARSIWGNPIIDGTITPNRNNTHDIGTSSDKFATIYATTFNGQATSVPSLSNSEIDTIMV